MFSKLNWTVFSFLSHNYHWMCVHKAYVKYTHTLLFIQKKNKDILSCVASVALPQASTYPKSTGIYWLRTKGSFGTWRQTYNVDVHITSSQHIINKTQAIKNKHARTLITYLYLETEGFQNTVFLICLVPVKHMLRIKTRSNNELWQRKCKSIKCTCTCMHLQTHQFQHLETENALHAGHVLLDVL